MRAVEAFLLFAAFATAPAPSFDAFPAPVPSAPAPDRFHAADGVWYERHPDGVYRAVPCPPGFR